MKQHFHIGDNLAVLAGFAANSFDALVCDPPAGIAFMNRAWDTDKGGRDQWIAWLQERAAQMLRVLKPGAFGLVWALPKTSHWTGMALENAGFAMHDRISHLFGSGFPKNPNTQLKPAMEDWWLVQKPFVGSAKSNVARHGTAFLNINACRIAAPEGLTGGGPGGRPAQFMDAEAGLLKTFRSEAHAGGRWPANILHDGSQEVLAHFESFGQKGQLFAPGHRMNSKSSITYGGGKAGIQTAEYSDTGTAARFFYAAKASPRDKQEGCANLLWRRNPKNPFGYDAIDQATYDALPERQRARGNVHPTVKNTELMRYLVRLITPTGGRVLDSFAGSGSTLKACEREGFEGVGIDLCPEAKLISDARCAFAALPKRPTTNDLKATQMAFA